MKEYFEEPVSDHLELAEHANKLMDKLYLLAAEVEGRQYPLPASLHERIASLDDEFADLGDQDITFSGEGFVPLITSEGEDTVYRIVEDMRGQFSQLYLADEEVIKYSTAEELLEEAEDEEGSLLEDPALREDVIGSLRTPPAGLQLYAEFSLETSVEDSAISGSAIRARGISYYAIMHAARLRLESLDERVHSEIDEETIEEYLRQASREVYDMVHSAEFKKRGADLQRALLEDRLTTLNQQLQLDRFTMFLPPQDVLAPDIIEGERLFAYLGAKDGVAGFSVDPIRVDSLDSFELSRGRQIKSNKQLEHFPYSGICIVCEIDEGARSTLDLPGNIIWVPIVFPRNKRKGVSVPGFSAHFEQLVH